MAKGFIDTVADGLRGMFADFKIENGRTDAPSRRTKKPPTDPAARFTSAHWGIEPDHVFADPDFDGELTEMGKLRELHCEWEDDNAEVHTSVFTFPKVTGNTQPPIVAFTTDTAERIYLSQPSAVKARNRKHILPDGEWVALDDAAREAGGRQTRWGYPRIKVQILGACTDIVYASNKGDPDNDGPVDGPSEYTHEFGEESGIVPFLCISADGRFWLAGGNYTVADEGITD